MAKNAYNIPNKSILWNRCIKIKRLANIGNSHGFSIPSYWLKELDIDKKSICQVFLNLADQTLVIKKIGQAENEE